MRDISSTRDASQAEVRTVVPEWTTSDTLELLEQCIELAEASSHVLARKVNVSLSELQYMRHLLRGNLGPMELARLLNVTSAASTGIVDRLEARGHVERRPHPQDRRRTEVVITDSGRTEMLRRLAPMFQRLAALDATFDDAERAVVERYLRGAIDAMHALDD